MEKRRLDPRVRFQQANFTRKLAEARNYKRNARPRPDSRLQAGLQKVGLASLLAQLLFSVFLITIVYVLYVPNPLFVRSVRIDGLSSEYQAPAQEALKKYQSSRPWYMPASNIFFFNSGEAAKAIADGVPAISKVQFAKKTFRNKTVIISVIQKYERYLVVRPEDQLVVFNDGTIKGQMTEKATSMAQSGAIVTVSVNYSDPVNNSQTYFEPKLIELIEQSASFFPDKTGQDFAYFEVKVPANEASTGTKFSDIWKKSGIAAVLNKRPQSGKSNPPLLKIILEPNLDIAATADRLKLLLEQTAPERYRSLDYVDLRLPNRAYLCLINTPCVNPNP